MARQKWCMRLRKALCRNRQMAAKESVHIALVRNDDQLVLQTLEVLI